MSTKLLSNKELILHFISDEPLKEPKFSKNYETFHKTIYNHLSVSPPNCSLGFICRYGLAKTFNFQYSGVEEKDKRKVKMFLKNFIKLCSETRSYSEFYKSDLERYGLLKFTLELPNIFVIGYPHCSQKTKQS